MNPDIPLSKALASSFDKPFCKLPKGVQDLVRQEFPPLSWDDLAVEQRRSVATQLDYRNNPDHEDERRFWFDHFQRIDDLKTQIQQWEAAATPTATDMEMKTNRLSELRKELATMEAQQGAATAKDESEVEDGRRASSPRG